MKRRSKVPKQLNELQEKYRFELPSLEVAKALSIKDLVSIRPSNIELVPEYRAISTKNRELEKLTTMQDEGKLIDEILRLHAEAFHADELTNWTKEMKHHLTNSFGLEKAQGYAALWDKQRKHLYDEERRKRKKLSKEELGREPESEANGLDESEKEMIRLRNAAYSAKYRNAHKDDAGFKERQKLASIKYRTKLKGKDSSTSDDTSISTAEAGHEDVPQLTPNYTWEWSDPDPSTFYGYQTDIQPPPSPFDPHIMHASIRKDGIMGEHSALNEDFNRRFPSSSQGAHQANVQHTDPYFSDYSLPETQAGLTDYLSLINFDGLSNMQEGQQMFTDHDEALYQPQYGGQTHVPDPRSPQYQPSFDFVRGSSVPFSTDGHEQYQQGYYADPSHWINEPTDHVSNRDRNSGGKNS